ncbi:MAG TPA: response regulator transcription factor, partial [Telluria sp.]|nr:response regulator transcription factor [Telluria sp.]
ENGADYLPALLANGVSRMLVLTGERRHGVLDAAIHAGARGVLGKDAPADVVVKAIEKIHAGELWLDRAAMNRVFATLLAPAAPAHDGAARHAALTERERSVIQAIVDHSDCMNKVVAQRLFMSEHTLRNHLSSIYHKLGVKTRLELYVYATGKGLARLAARSLH